jgi:hypothetical protein
MRPQGAGRYVAREERNMMPSPSSTACFPLGRSTDVWLDLFSEIEKQGHGRRRAFSARGLL